MPTTTARRRRDSAAAPGPTVTARLTVERIIFASPDGQVVIAVCRPCVERAAPRDAVAPDGLVRAVFPGDCGGVVRPGTTVDAVGGWIAHPKYGMQLRVTGVTPAAPGEAVGGRGAAEWLAEQVDGIGGVSARRVVDALGPAALDRLRDDPAAFDSLAFLAPGQRDALRAAVGELRQGRERIAVFVWCRDHGLGPTMAGRVWAAWGSAAPAVLTTDPFRLAELDRAGFLTADALAGVLGTDPLAPSRLRAATLYAAREAADGEGHTCLPARHLLAAARALLKQTGRPAGGVPGGALETAVRACAERGDLVAEGAAPGGDALLWLSEFLDAEREVARRVTALAAADCGGGGADAVLAGAGSGD